MTAQSQAEATSATQRMLMGFMPEPVPGPGP